MNTWCIYTQMCVCVCVQVFLCYKNKLCVLYFILYTLYFILIKIQKSSEKSSDTVMSNFQSISIFWHFNIHASPLSHFFLFYCCSDLFLVKKITFISLFQISLSRKIYIWLFYIFNKVISFDKENIRSLRIAKST